MYIGVWWVCVVGMYMRCVWCVYCVVRGHTCVQVLLEVEEDAGCPGLLFSILVLWGHDLLLNLELSR